MGWEFGQKGHRDAAAWCTVDLESTGVGADELLQAQNKKVANRGSAVYLPWDRARGSFLLHRLLRVCGQGCGQNFGCLEVLQACT